MYIFGNLIAIHLAWVWIGFFSFNQQHFWRNENLKFENALVFVQ